MVKVKGDENMNWNYFNKFKDVKDKYLPDVGEGETMASQIVTAVNKLVYKWYNDGDVFDNTYQMEGWVNDLSSYANWLYEHCDKTTQCLLDTIKICDSEWKYENLLMDLADHLLDMKKLEIYENRSKVGSIYKCYGKYKFNDDGDFYRC